MGITSMGIFGFLSNSYQISSMDIGRIQIQLQSNEEEYKRASEEVKRMNEQIDAISADQTTKKLMLQKRYEPLITDYTRKSNDALNNLNNLKLEQLKTHSKVGPLIYVARAFNTNIDNVVKWLIIVFVTVFDPLAICLVIATSSAIKIRSEDKAEGSHGGAKKDEPIAYDKPTEEPEAAAAA